MPLLPPLRLLADDLTGALDSAAAFASIEAPVAVIWQGEVPATGAVAVDSASRELAAEAARAAVQRQAAALWPSAPGLAFKKVDSLLRGHEAVELLAALEVLQPRRCIIAPAFPAQGRVTRGGRQGIITDGTWQPVAADLAAALEAAGHQVARCAAGASILDGISFVDAESDADLDGVVVSAGGDDVLWVGSAGLAAALARASGAMADSVATTLPRPVLGLVGSDHPVAAGQLAALGDLHHALGSDGEIVRRLSGNGVAFASVVLPPGTPRPAAAALIAARFAALVQAMAPPATLFAAGGETLRGLCEALGAERLDVTGEIMPGVPRSILRGGAWDGVAVVSKSGAFGGPDLLAMLVAAPAASAGSDHFRPRAVAF